MKIGRFPSRKCRISLSPRYQQQSSRRLHARSILLIDRLNADLLDCEIAVEIDPDVIEPCWLGEKGQGLGWNTWLGEDAPELAPALGDTVSRTVHSPGNDPMVA